MNQTTVTSHAKPLHGKRRTALCCVVVSVLILTFVAWAQAEEGSRLSLSALTCEHCDALHLGEGSPQPAPLPTSATLSSFEIELVDLVNQERMRNSLMPLAIHPALQNAALAHSQDMSANDFFGHVGSDGATFLERLMRAGYTNITAAGENIAEYPGVDQAEVGFMNSPGHRANILGDYTRVGIGIVNRNGTYFITLWFAK